MSWPMLKYRAARIEARSGMSFHQRRIEAEKDLRFWTNVGLGIAVVIGLAVIACHPGVRTAGIAAYGAALGVGGVLGFLFGVPSASKTPSVSINKASSVAVGTGNDSKTVSANLGASTTPATPLTAPINAVPGDNPSQPAAAPAISSAMLASNPADPPVDKASADLGSGTSEADSSNAAGFHNPNASNLEQVADWVTKLLLGGGLTQMQRIPPKIWQWSHAVAMGIIGDQEVSAQRVLAEQSFAAGLLVYGFILGFFCGYLITKLQLGKAIAD